MKTKILGWSAGLGILVFIACGFMSIMHVWERFADIAGMCGLWVCLVSFFVIFTMMKKELDAGFCATWFVRSSQVMVGCALYGVTAVVITDIASNIPDYLFRISDIVEFIGMASVVSFVVSFIANMVKAQWEQKHA